MCSKNLHYKRILPLITHQTKGADADKNKMKIMEYRWPLNLPWSTECIAISKIINPFMTEADII